ncbi:hypothetical protein A2165_02620 [Candidatus Curtissbacteria bacterium RBG_13_40_7]|uniref:MIP18 family-like domain-containing protein n=1 Tax=Candidatus Curtissbacteria bacterium RBG_13_40_7 TaxID=1797706 RepID=A0A1F5FZG2_9BACT|nr:MAG: hypothetical protein A2165_02620 [Candidatus Curtissbacteria bacterium RBG_13_40_7]
MVSHEDVLIKLKQCLDPELGMNIVDLGLVYSIKIEGSHVLVLMTLTTSSCPLQTYFIKDISDKLSSVKGVSEVSVELTFDPPWTPDKISSQSGSLFSNYTD